MRCVVEERVSGGFFVVVLDVGEYRYVGVGVVVVYLMRNAGHGCGLEDGKSDRRLPDLRFAGLDWKFGPSRSFTFRALQLGSVLV